MRGVGYVFAIVIAGLLALFQTVQTSAERFTGGSYTIDASVVGNSFGGSNSGGSYQLTSSGGESIIGEGSGGSYRLDSGYTAQLTSSLQLALQPGNLTTYYNFEEASGTQGYDNSSNGLNGEILGAVSRSAGKVGNALDYNGTSTTMRVGNPTALQATSGTIVAWEKTSVTGASLTIFAKPTSYILTVNFNRISTYDWNTGTTCQAATPGGIANGSWHHVAMTYESGVTNGTKLYLDGNLMATCTITFTSNVGVVTVGSSNANGTSFSQYFNGSLDEVRHFGRVFSQTEVQADMDAGNAGNTAGLTFATDITPGTSQTSDYDAIVQTDAQNGYNLNVNQNQNLTKGPDTISPVSGSIASPVSWIEGTTKGLGFTLFGTNATAIPGKWSSGAAYAAIPGSSTSYYTRTGQQLSTKDVLNMRLRLDVPTSQVNGAYSNVMTTTGTITP